MVVPAPADEAVPLARFTDALTHWDTVQQESCQRLKTTLPVAPIGVMVAVSFSVADQVAVPDDSVPTDVFTLVIVTTQSEGSELGSCDGYEQELSRVPPVQPCDAQIRGRDQADVACRPACRSASN